MWGVFDLERLAFYCKQCHTMAEGGAINMPEGIMVRCHGDVEVLGDHQTRVPPGATKDDPHVIQVFRKPKPVDNSPWAPKRPNLRFFCAQDNKIIGDFQYQHDTSIIANGSTAGQVHVFIVKCTGQRCSGGEHKRLFTAAQLSDDQMYGKGPPLVIDLNPNTPIPHRKGIAVPSKLAEPVRAAQRLPGVHSEGDHGKGKLPPTRLITLEED